MVFTLVISCSFLILKEMAIDVPCATRKVIAATTCRNLIHSYYEFILAPLEYYRTPV